MKFVHYFTLLSCLFASSLVGTGKNVRAANAEGQEEKILTTDPFEDLIEDEKFKTDYLNGVYKYKEGDIEFLNIAEYKYQNEYSEDFGLYIYFYNPDDGRKIDLLSDDNKIELATDGTNYKKYNLKAISRSTGEIQDLFYKFRVETDQTFYESLDSSSRTYNLSSFELKIKGESQIHDIEIGSTFVYSGYAKGCNNNDESTLECHKTGLETIHLKTYGGTKRSGYVNSDLTKAIDLHYVYFEIPNKYIDTYGEPYAVSYEYYDAYLDKGIFNIRDHDYYIEDKWYQHGDDHFSSIIEFIDPWLYNNTPGAYMNQLFIINDIKNIAKNNLFYTFNPRSNSPYDRVMISTYPDICAAYRSDYLYKDNAWRYYPETLNQRLFRKSEWNSEISSQELEDRINSYGLSYFSTNIQYSGPITTTINDIEDPAVIYTDHPNYSYWEKMLGDVTSDGKTPWGRTQDAGTTWGAVKGFEMVTSRDDSSGSIWNIDKKDVDNFNDIYDSTVDNDSSLFLLRFHETEYWSAPVYFERQAIAFAGTEYTPIGYSAFTHVIDKFDIISLTFKMDNEYSVIPVVNDPIRIVPGITPPVDDRPEDYSWWDKITKSMNKLNIKLILGIVAGIILVILVIKLISKISNIRSQKIANKANKTTIKEAKKRRRDKEKHGEKE